MRWVVRIILVAILLLSRPAVAERYTLVEEAGDLYKLCESNNDGNKAVCFAFVAGVFEVAVNNPIDGIRSCVPLRSNTNVLAAQKLTLKWMAAHPEKEMEPASRAIAEALAEAFPCGTSTSH